MKIQIDPVEVNVRTGGGWTPPASGVMRVWVSPTYKTVQPGDTVELGGLPYFGVVMIGGREFLIGNQYKNILNIIDIEAETMHKASMDATGVWLGRSKSSTGLSAGQAVRVMEGSKYGGQIYMVLKDSQMKVQCNQPGGARVIIERQWLVPINAELKELP